MKTYHPITNIVGSQPSPSKMKIKQKVIDIKM